MDSAYSVSDWQVHVEVTLSNCYSVRSELPANIVVSESGEHLLSVYGMHYCFYCLRSVKCMYSMYRKQTYCVECRGNGIAYTLDPECGAVRTDSYVIVFRADINIADFVQRVKTHHPTFGGFCLCCKVIKVAIGCCADCINYYLQLVSRYRSIRCLCDRHSIPVEVSAVIASMWMRA